MSATIATIPFQWSFSGKSAAPVELEDGSLIIEGTGANWEVDLESERFLPAAFARDLKRWLASGGPLCYAHHKDQIVGRVLDAEVRPNGVWLKAVVDPQPLSSPLRWVYEGIKRGRINGLSCSGIFKRRETPSGPVIEDVTLVEWSVAPIPIGKGTTFKVVAQKALTAPAGVGVGGADDLSTLRAQVARMESDVLGLRLRRTMETMRHGRH